MNQRLWWMCAAASYCLSAAVSAAQLVVVASTVPGIGPGQVIDSDGAIEIPAGAELTLISQAGRMTRLAGPHSGAPGGGDSAGDPQMLASLSKLFKGSGQESGTLGAMRSMGSAAPDAPWSVDVTRTGTHCFPPDGGVELWRDKSAASSQLTMSNLAGGGRVRTAWPAGHDSLAWPPDLPLADGASYAARVSGRATAAKLQMVALPGELPSDAHRAAWMAEHGCESQARRLLGMM